MEDEDDYVHTSEPGFVKDVHTGMVINLGLDEYEAAVLARRKYLEDQDRLNEIDNLKRDVADMKSTLNLILEALNK